MAAVEKPMYLFGESKVASLRLMCPLDHYKAAVLFYI